MIKRSPQPACDEPVDDDAGEDEHATGEEKHEEQGRREIFGLDPRRPHGNFIRRIPHGARCAEFPERFGFAAAVAQHDIAKHIPFFVTAGGSNGFHLRIPWLLPQFDLAACTLAEPEQMFVDFVVHDPGQERDHGDPRNDERGDDQRRTGERRFPQQFHDDSILYPTPYSVWMGSAAPASSSFRRRLFRCTYTNWKLSVMSYVSPQR